MQKLKIKIKDLYELIKNNPDGKKFYVRDPKENLVPILDAVKKENVPINKVVFENHSRLVAQTHRFMDKDGNEVFAKDAKEIKTKDSTIQIKENFFYKNGDVYDILIDNPHWYLDQYDVIHHNTGKTLMKSAMAKQCLLQNYKVLFIPLEGTEEDIRNRIMFNIMDMTQDELKALEKDAFKDLLKKIKESIKSKLIIKRFNQHSFNASKLRVLLKELKNKLNFVPDIVFLDYMGLTIPNIINKDSGNQAAQLKRASEEFHGVSKDEDFALVSSMQFNREGFKSSNPNMDDISESFGTLFTADEVILLMQTEEMRKNNKYIYKKVKARSKNKDFVGNLNVDFERQKLFESDTNHKNEEERKKIEKMVEAESGEVQEMIEKVEQFQSRKMITAEIT